MKFVKMVVTYLVVGGLTTLGGVIARDAYEASKDPYKQAKVKRKFNKIKDAFIKD